MTGRWLSLFWASIFVFSTLPFSLVRADSAGPSVVITEIKLGGGNDVTFADNTKAKDFVAIFNMTTTPLDLTGWKLEYAKSTFSSSNCSSASWAALTSASNTTGLSGTLAAGSVSSPIKRSLTDNESGSLRLLDAQGVVHDVVGWGPNAPCYEDAAASLPGSGKSLQRYLECDEDLPIDSHNNFEDFLLSSTPGPGALADVRQESCSVSEPPAGSGSGGSSGGTAPPATSACEGAVISELLPNPAGSDEGQEFIELHNPTSAALSLKNCQLQTSGGSPVYEFGDTTLASGQYVAFYDDQTGLSMANSAGGSVWLLDHADVELGQVDYPADLEDDQAWALIGTQWQGSYTVTPNAENILMAVKPCPTGQVRNLETNRCHSSSVASTSLKPCEPGKVRNPATNRCRSSETVGSALTPCAPGKERNPLTNRCRSSSSVLSALTPCDPGEFRNPATNRCKKSGSSSSLVPCRLDHERNPDTNRCRKKTTLAGNSLNEVKDVPAESVANKTSWWFAGAGVVGAAGYGLFEWRREFLGGLKNIKSKFTSSPSD